MDRPANPKALIPIVVFIVLYLSLGIIMEYGMGKEMGFYQVPVIWVFLVALLVACLQNRKLSFDAKMCVMAKGVGQPNILTMIFIFLCAGAFIGIIGRSGAESMSGLFLSLFPPEYSVVVLFTVAALVSLAMGTSVGTITLITPVAVAVSEVTSFGIPLTVGAVVGGAMFGDNLSFISDTTIAACQGQGCGMREKFIENSRFAIPAALITVAVFAAVTVPGYGGSEVTGDYDLHLILPYFIVLAASILGANVFVSLILGMVSGAVIMIGGGYSGAYDVMINIGDGISGMLEITVVAILVSALVALVIENGGFEAILRLIKKVFKGPRGGMCGMGILVGAMDVSTANNTVAIVMANPLAKEISEAYGISAKRTASILDSVSCVFQVVIPYGVQMLVALAVVSKAGYECSAFDIIPNLVYPFVLLICLVLFVAFVPDRRTLKS